MVIGLTVFLMVTLGFLAGSQLFSWYFRRDAQRVHQRIADTFGKAPQADAQVALYGSLSHLDLDLEQMEVQASPAPGARADSAGLRRRMEILLEQSRVPLTPQLFLLVFLGLALALGMSAFWFGGPLVGLAAMIAGAAAPVVLVDVKAKARREKFLKQLPNAFELMARVIRAGQSVPQALNSVAESFEDPIAGEFASCQQQQNLGLRPEVTFQELVLRSGIVELRIFAMAMLIQRQTGGNLSEVLERLAGLIRARLRLRQQVRAWTAEGRLQGWTLFSLPFLMFGVLMVINRQYVSVLFDHVSLLVATVALMAVGMLWIRKIVNFDY